MPRPKSTLGGSGVHNARWKAHLWCGWWTPAERSRWQCCPRLQRYRRHLHGAKTKGHIHCLVCTLYCMYKVKVVSFAQSEAS